MNNSHVSEENLCMKRIQWTNSYLLLWLKSLWLEIPAVKVSELWNLSFCSLMDEFIQNNSKSEPDSSKLTLAHVFMFSNENTVEQHRHQSASLQFMKRRLWSIDKSVCSKLLTDASTKAHLLVVSVFVSYELSVLAVSWLDRMALRLDD